MTQLYRLATVRNIKTNVLEAFMVPVGEEKGLKRFIRLRKLRGEKLSAPLFNDREMSAYEFERTMASADEMLDGIKITARNV